MRSSIQSLIENPKSSIENPIHQYDHQ
jgi:hypothetical protein